MIIKNDVIEIVTSTFNDGSGLSPKEQFRLNMKNSEINRELRFKYKLANDSPSNINRVFHELASAEPVTFE
jgi:hypothetical protein